MIKTSRQGELGARLSNLVISLLRCMGELDVPGAALVSLTPIDVIILCASLSLARCH